MQRKEDEEMQSPAPEQDGIKKDTVRPANGFVAKAKTYANWRRNKLGIIIGGITLFVVLGSIFIVYQMNRAMTKYEVEHGTQKVIAATHFDSPTAVVNKVHGLMPGQAVVVTRSDGTGGVSADGIAAYSLPVYRLSDKKFSTVPITGTGNASRGDVEVQADNYEKLKLYLKAKYHFSEVKDEIGKGIPAYLTTAKGFQLTDYAVYTSDDIRCAVWLATVSSLSSDNTIVSIGCASIKDYDKAAGNLTPFYEAYLKVVKNAQNVVMSTPVSLNGNDNDVMVYQEADGKVVKGHYTRPQKSSDWKFVSE